MRRVMLTIAGLCALTVAGVAQQPSPQPTPRFEVASVKPLPAGSNIAGYRPEPTRFSGYFSVVDAVVFAYQMQLHRIVDAPQWAKDQRYEISATTGQRKPGDLLPMMQTLLAERFALKVHRERRPMPAYALTLSRSDGQLGPKLQRVDRNCTPPVADFSGCSIRSVWVAIALAASSGVRSWKTSNCRRDALWWTRLGCRDSSISRWSGTRVSAVCRSQSSTLRLSRNWKPDPHCSPHCGNSLA